ncbi:unannotated protein [freshwater metagenome]|uniref:Unannotated protein n=1 Tax=freshwater metagenome TaxID=449393 RepID=A0A6J7LBV5_9ZZZZ
MCEGWLASGLESGAVELPSPQFTVIAFTVPRSGNDTCALTTVVVNVNLIGAFTADAGPAVAAIPRASRAEVVSTATMRRRLNDFMGVPPGSG